MKKLLLAAAGLVLLISAVFFLIARSSRGEEKLAKIVRRQLEERLTGRVELGSLSGDLPSHLILHDVVIYDLDGKEAVRIAELELRLDVWSLPTRHIKVPLIKASGLQLHARTLRDGRLNLAALARTSSDEKSKTTIELQSVKLEGEASWEGEARGAVQAGGALTIAPDQTTLRVDALQVKSQQPARAELAASGTLRIGEDLGFQGVVADLRSADLARFQPRLKGAWRAHVVAHGPLSRLQIETEVTPPLGKVQARAELSLPKISFSASASETDNHAHAEGRIDLNGDADVRATVDARDLKPLGASGALRAEGHVVRKNGQLRLDADAHGRSLAFSKLRLATLEAHARVGDRVRLTVAGQGPDGAIALRAHGRMRQNAASITLDKLALNWHGTAVRSAEPAHLKLGPLMAVDRLSLVSGSQRLSVSGRWNRLRRTFSAQLFADLRSLKELPLGVSGRAQVQLKLSGSEQSPEIALRVDGDQLAWRELRQSRLRAQLDYRHHKLQTQLEAQLNQAGNLKLSAALPIDLVAALRARRLPNAPVEAALQLNGLLVAALLPDTPLRAGAVYGTVSVSGKLRTPRFTAELSGNHLAAYGLSGVDVSLRAASTGDQLRVQLQSDVRRAPLLFARATLKLRRDWKSAPLDVQLVVPDYPLAGGGVSAVAELHGSLDHPWGHISASAEKIDYRQLRLSRATVEGDFDGRTLSASLSAQQPEGGSLRADGALPLDAAAPWSVLISAVNLKLAAENLGALRKLDGRLDAKLSLAGTRRAPIVSGALHVKDGALALVGMPQLYQDITADVGASGQHIEVQKLAFSSSGGKVQAKGRVELAGITPKSIDLHADISHLPVAEGPVGAWIDAQVGLHVDHSGSGFRGALTLEKGTAHLPKLAAGRKLQPTGPLKEVVFTDKKARREAARRRAAERDEIPMTALLAARIPGPFHIRSPELMTDLDGELQIEVVGPVARVSGSIKSSGGWIELLGRRYDLDRVRLGFGGQTEIDPELDVRITREISDAVIAVEVQGTAKHPKLTFSSDPPIYDEAQIIGIVVSGDPGQSRTSDRSLDQKVVGALSGLIVGKLKDQIAPGLPIDVIKVDTGDSGYTGLAATRVEVGKYITEKIYVSYVHQFGELQIGTRRLNANEANVEWRFKKHLEVDTRFGDAAVGALDFFWTFRY